MKNEQQSQNLLLKVEPRSTFLNIFLLPSTNVFVARQVDHGRWKTGNIDENLQRNDVARQVESFCISYFVAFKYARAGVDNDALSTTPPNTRLKLKQNFPTVTKSTLMNLFLNQVDQNIGFET